MTALRAYRRRIRHGNIDWIAATSGLWSTSANWSPAQIPSIGDTALISLPGAYLVSLPGSAAIDSLILGDASAAFSIGGSLNAATGVTVSAGTLTVAGTLDTAALNNQGTLTITGFLDAVDFSNTGTLLLNSGTVTLTGTTDSASLDRIGGGSGTLWVQGTVVNAGATLDGTPLLGQIVPTLGTILGGTVTNLYNPGLATLDGVTWRGTLAPSAALTIRDGLTIFLRLTEREVALIDRATAICGRSRTEFVREAAIRSAQRHFMPATPVHLSQSAFEAFSRAVSSGAARGWMP